MNIQINKLSEHRVFQQYCLGVFDHFEGLAVKGLRDNFSTSSSDPFLYLLFYILAVWVNRIYIYDT